MPLARRIFAKCCMFLGDYRGPAYWKDSTTLRPNNTSRTAIGTIPRTVQAIRPLQSGVPPACCWRKALIATAITRTDSERPTRNGQKNSFQADKAVRIVSVASAERWTGRTIRKKMAKYDAPSMRADSSNSRGVDKNIWRRKNTANGVMSAYGAAIP